MSIAVASAVWDRFEGASGELLLALALANFAHDDGTEIFPSVARLARMTRQSERTVQVQLRKMEARGWLQLVENAKGGRAKARVYRVNPTWLKGEAIAAPFTPSIELLDEAKGCGPTLERVKFTTVKGEAATAPEPSLNHQEPSRRAATIESIKKRKVARKPRGCTAPRSLAVYLQDCAAANAVPITAEASVFRLAESKGIPSDFIDLAWSEFKRHHRPGGKSESTEQRDWPTTFRNAVDGNWYRLWWCRPDGAFELTGAGREALKLLGRQVA